jgi:hypothetical protein
VEASGTVLPMSTVVQNTTSEEWLFTNICCLSFMSEKIMLIVIMNEGSFVDYYNNDTDFLVHEKVHLTQS